MKEELLANIAAAGEKIKQIENWFCHHSTTTDQLERFAHIRDVCGKRLALAIALNPEDFDNAWSAMKAAILECCPDSVERKYALFSLESLPGKTPEQAMLLLRFSVIMPANAAIACNSEVTNEG